MPRRNLPRARTKLVLRANSAAGADIYEPEKVVGERQKNLGNGKTETQYEVKWKDCRKDWDKKHNTYQPIAHPSWRAARI